MARPCVTPIMIARALLSSMSPEDRVTFVAWLTGEVSIDDQRNRAAGMPPAGQKEEIA